jgi:hypothetical protein
VFDDDSLRIGTVALPGKRMLCLFNWDDAPVTIATKLPRASRVTDFWTGEPLGRLEAVTITNLPGRSARLLEYADV